MQIMIDKLPAQFSSPMFWGKFAVILSAIFFYMATYYIKIADSLAIPVFVFAFFRFFLGYIFTTLWNFSAGKEEYQDLYWIRMRAFWNLIAVIFFFAGVAHGSITNANVLNMTYPIFVAFFAAVFLREKISGRNFLSLIFILSGTGIFLGNSTLSMEWGDIFSILSAVTAGISLVALKEARKRNSSRAVLHYQFLTGTLFTGFIVAWLYWKNPFVWNYLSVFLLLASGFLGVAGQYLLTVGYRYVGATQGSILSNSRIWIALLVGWLIFQEDIGWEKWLGGAAIFLANLITAADENKKA